jgi:thymidine kinase
VLLRVVSNDITHKAVLLPFTKASPGGSMTGRFMRVPMAKLYFSYAAMNAGKSTILLQASHNYRERGMNTLLLTARLDDRVAEGRIGSRIGLESAAFVFDGETDMTALVATENASAPLACVMVDEAQFLTDTQVWQLAGIADEMGIPVMCYGLRTDFQGNMFPGSARLLAIADVLREIRTICHCGRKATMVVRQDNEGRVIREGAQVEIGGNERYISLCRRHWVETMAQT